MRPSWGNCSSLHRFTLADYPTGGIIGHVLWQFGDVTGCECNVVDATTRQLMWSKR